MSQKRIIPCLDVREGRVVKGIRFEGIRDVGDPAECARLYERQGADELVFLDITATVDGRATMLSWVKQVAGSLSIPLCVGGGISDAAQAQAILDAGAAKISVNSAAVRNPQLIRTLAERFGSACVVVAIDVARHADGNYTVLVSGGKTDTGLDAVRWAKQAQELGAGEILLTSLDADGTKDGFDLEITRLVADAVAIPVTASGGCGKLADFSDVFEQTRASAALAASLFHYRELTVAQVKEYLAARGIPVRL